MLPCSFLGHSPMGYTTEATRRPSPSQTRTSQCWLESKDQLCIFGTFSKAWAANSARAKLCPPAGRSFWLRVQMSMFTSKLCFLKPDFGKGHPENKVSWIRTGQDERALLVPLVTYPARHPRGTAWLLPSYCRSSLLPCCQPRQKEGEPTKGKGQ